MASETIKSSFGLIRWPFLSVARASETGGDPRFGATFVVGTPNGLTPADQQFLEAIMKAMDAASFNKWNMGVTGMKQRCDTAGKRFSLALKRNDDPKRSKHAGIGSAPAGFHFEAKSKFPIDCFDQSGAKLNPQAQPISADLAASMFYDGAVCRVWVSPYTFEHPTGGLGVGLNLNGVQFVRGAMRLGGAAIDADAVDPNEVPDGYGAVPDPIAIGQAPAYGQGDNNPPAASPEASYLPNGGQAAGGQPAQQPPAGGQKSGFSF
jgi:hypothetical protein